MIKKRWIILMTAMTLIAVAGLFVGEPTFDCDWKVISAACRFSMEAWWVPRMSSLPCCSHSLPWD